MMNRIGVLTSGGDAPGMNAAIRSIVRTAVAGNIAVYGILDGYLGLYENRMIELDRNSVSDLINRGGTFLGSARFKNFQELATQKMAVEHLRSRHIDGLIVIGGDGSYLGAKCLTELGIPCIGIPGTIDNDVAGTDYSIGYFTALETVISAIDKLRDTSSSHQRISVVEVMGRHCGDLTLAAAIAGGCEFIAVPELPFDQSVLLRLVQSALEAGKRHAIIAITEHLCDDVELLAKFIEESTGRETRATVLGHVQRGGSPVAFDRLLASRMGAYAVGLLQEGVGGRCIGLCNDDLVHQDIFKAIETMKRQFNKALFDVARKLF